jgi:hypothetical protein
VRGNRSNVYLLYPPEYYCEEYNEKAQGERGAPLENLDDHFTQTQGESPAPLEIPRVNVVHSEGERGALSGCTENTLRVNAVHLKSTNINNKENHSLKQKPKTGESDLFYKEIKENEISEIRKVFTNKGVQVSDKMIISLLKDHDPKAVKAAIKSTDFKAAINPLSVIKWMLNNDTYVMPIEIESTIPNHPEAIDPINPEDDEAIRSMIKEAKKGLLKKTVQSV